MWCNWYVVFNKGGEMKVKKKIKELEIMQNIVNNIRWDIVIQAVKNSPLFKHLHIETEYIKLKGLQQLLKKKK